MQCNSFLLCFIYILYKCNFICRNVECDRVTVYLYCSYLVSCWSYQSYLTTSAQWTHCWLHVSSIYIYIYMYIYIYVYIYISVPQPCWLIFYLIFICSMTFSMLVTYKVFAETLLYLCVKEKIQRRLNLLCEKVVISLFQNITAD